MRRALFFVAIAALGLISCKKKGCTDPSATNYNPDAKKDDGTCEFCVGPSVSSNTIACDQTLSITPTVTWGTSGSNRTVTCNHIPNHQVGAFPNSGNPHSIQAVNENLTMPLNPVAASSTTAVADNGPKYSFGIDLNGVEYDPAAAEAFEVNGAKDWDWTLEATANSLGLDCNNAHVQPNGEYHYHGTPAQYFAGLGINGTAMTLVGYAADGFPIYYKYAYSDPNNSSSSIVAMTSSYRLKSGDRGGDGTTSPCGAYNGVYVQDYEYASGLGDLDECNGRTGVTPEFPGGTYYYMITDAFPGIPRCFKGTPSNDFKIQP